MEFRQMGKSTLWVSTVGLGGMSLSSNQNEVDTTLNLAVDSGLNLIDTADLYDKGQNEERIGKALKGRREKVMLSTKVGNIWNNDGKTWFWNPSREHILSAADSSLKRLRTDYIDIYMLHGGTIEDPIDEIVEAFERLKEQGKIRTYGLSSIRPNVIRQFVQRSSIDCVMMQYSLLDRRPEEEMLGLLGENSISVLARGVLAKGLLAGKPASDYLSHNRQDVQSVQKQLLQLANPLKAALGFPLKRREVASAVIGVSTMNQLREVVAAYQSPQEEVELSGAFSKVHSYDKHL